jgi:hypothetical protein
MSQPEGRGGAWTEKRNTREPKGRGTAWTLFVPTDPPQGRRRSDEGRRRLESVPEASGGNTASRRQR